MIIFFIRALLSNLGKTHSSPNEHLPKYLVRLGQIPKLKPS